MSRHPESISYRKIRSGQKDTFDCGRGTKPVHECPGYVDHSTTIDKSIIEQVVSDKQELGLSAPSSVGDQIELPDNGYQGNGRLLKRLESLEKRVNYLTASTKRQIEEHERRAEGYKDTLVHRLERMLSQERKRADKLLVYCNLLRNKLNLTTINSEEKKGVINNER